MDDYLSPLNSINPHCPLIAPLLNCEWLSAMRMWYYSGTLLLLNGAFHIFMLMFFRMCGIRGFAWMTRDSKNQLENLIKSGKLSMICRTRQSQVQHCWKRRNLQSKLILVIDWEKIWSVHYQLWNWSPFLFPAIIPHTWHKLQISCWTLELSSVSPNENFLVR